jgi:hypothetical protein
MNLQEKYLKELKHVVLVKFWLTKRKPDLRARDHLPLLYVDVEGILPAQVFRFFANRLRRR